MKMIIFLIGGLIAVLNHFKLEISTNQEYYLGLARWWADPSWIPGSFLMADKAGTRIGFNLIMTPFWDLASLEAIALAATFLNLFLIGGLIFLIAREVHKISVISIILLHLTLFSGLGDKGFYAGEWIFGGAEPKTFCYIFCLSAILLFMRNKYIWSFLLVAIAAYFHVLIAGWVLAILLMDTLLRDGWKFTFKSFAVFIAGILPLFFYLLSTWFQKGPSSYAGEINQILISNLHSHLKPWLVEGREYRFYGGLVYAFLAAAIAFYRQRKAGPQAALLYRLSIYAFLIPALLVPLSIWEWSTPILMTFPFRLTMMQKILFFIPAVMEISRFLEKYRWRKQLTAALVVIFVFSAALRIKKNIIARWGNYQDPDLLKIAEVLEENYPPGTSVVYLDAKTEKPDDKLDPLQRKARVDVFFSNKFLPFSPERLIEWQRRKDLIIQVRNDLSQLELLDDEEIEVVISKQALPLKLIEEVSEYKIYDFNSLGLRE